MLKRRSMKGNKRQRNINIASWMALVTVVFAVYHLFSDGDFSFLMVNGFFSVIRNIKIKPRLFSDPGITVQRLRHDYASYEDFDEQVLCRNIFEESPAIHRCVLFPPVINYLARRLPSI